MSFALSALATWRLTHLLVDEDGPADAVVRLRRAAGSGALGQAMDCFYCASVWVALPIAAGLTRAPSAGEPCRRATAPGRLTRLQRVVTWLALSGAACLLEQATRSGSTRAPAGEPVHAMAGEPGTQAGEAGMAHAGELGVVRSRRPMAPGAVA